MGTLFAVLLIVFALVAVIAVMWVVLREKEEQDAHLRYVRSPWNEENTEAQTELEEHIQQAEDQAPGTTVDVPEPDTATGEAESPAEDAEGPAAAIEDPTKPE